MPLVNCIVNDGLVNVMPNMQQTLLQFINVVHLQLIDSLLDDEPYLVVLVDRVEVRTVWWPQIRWNESRHCLLEKLYSVRFAKIQTYKFRKVVWQHTEGVVGSNLWVLLEI